MKKQNGITLIALIITIIVMLILVGVTINFALNGGIIDKAKEASIQMEIATIQEQLMLKKAEILADNMGSVPAEGYGLTSISDLDGLSESTVNKYNSKLTISSDGTLYYLEDKVTGEEKVYFENAGIKAYQGQAETIEYYSMSFQEGGKTYEIVFAIDYVNSTIKIYNGEQNGKLSLQEGPINVTISTNSFTALIDDVEKTITGATVITMDGSPVAYIQNNKAYTGEIHENELSEFSSESYATLVSNFDTTRLVESEQEPASSSIYNASYVYTYEDFGGLTVRYVFLENGTYIYTLGITGISPALTYSISGNTIIFADPDMDGKTHTMTISDDLTQITLVDDNITLSRDQENFFIDSAENKSVDSDTGMYLNSIYKGTNNLYIVICDGIVTIYSKLGSIGDRMEATYCSLSEAISDKGFVVSEKTITYNDVVYTLVESESDIITN